MVAKFNIENKGLDLALGIIPRDIQNALDQDNQVCMNLSSY